MIINQTLNTRSRSRKRSRKSAYDLVKIRNWSRVSGVISATESESEESERFHFLPTPLTTPSLTFRLWSSENQIVGVGSRSGRISQSECTFPRFVIGLVLLLLLPTPTIWFSLDHKRNAASFPVVLGDFGCDVTADVTCQACRENSARTVPSLLWSLG